MAPIGSGLGTRWVRRRNGAHDLGHELLLADGVVLQVHARCALLWEALRTALMS